MRYGRLETVQTEGSNIGPTGLLRDLLCQRAPVLRAVLVPV